VVYFVIGRLSFCVLCEWAFTDWDTLCVKLPNRWWPFCRVHWTLAFEEFRDAPLDICKNVYCVGPTAISFKTMGYLIQSTENNINTLCPKNNGMYCGPVCLLTAEELWSLKCLICNLIELSDNEFTEIRQQITLSASNKTLAPGEFLRVVGIDGEIRTRICLEDLYPLGNSGGETDDMRGLIVILHVFYLYFI